MKSFNKKCMVFPYLIFMSAIGTEAEAQDVRSIGSGWMLYESPTPGSEINACNISKRGSSGTDMEVMYSTGNFKFKLSFNNANWRNLQNDGEVRIKLAFYPEEYNMYMNTTPINVTSLHRGVYVFIESARDRAELLMQIAKSKSLVVSLDDSKLGNAVLGEFDLTGSENAVRAHIACGSEKKSEKTSDPFQ